MQHIIRSTDIQFGTSRPQRLLQLPHLLVGEREVRAGRSSRTSSGVVRARPHPASSRPSSRRGVEQRGEQQQTQLVPRAAARGVSDQLLQLCEILHDTDRGRGFIDSIHLIKSLHSAEAGTAPVAARVRARLTV